MSDRIAALLLLILAVLYGYNALSFRATFFTDPLGARAIPLAIAIFMVPVAIYLLVRAQPTAKWPPRRAWLSVALALVAFIGYSLLIQPLGFLIATTLFFVVFGWLHAAKLWQAALSGFVFSIVLYVVFVWGLDLYLPVGDVFSRSL